MGKDKEMNNKSKVSAAQKAAQRKYDKEKTKMLSVKYTPVEMEDYYKLKDYIEESGESVNGLLKELIHTFLENKDKSAVTHGTIQRVTNKISQAEIYYPYTRISPDNLEYLYKIFGRTETDHFLDYFRKRTINAVVEEKGDEFNEWLEKRIINILLKSNPWADREWKLDEMYRLLKVRFPQK